MFVGKDVSVRIRIGDDVDATPKCVIYHEYCNIILLKSSGIFQILQVKDLNQGVGVHELLSYLLHAVGIIFVHKDHH